MGNENKSLHTPGPWRIASFEDCKAMNSIWVVVADCPGKKTIIVVANTWKTKDSLTSVSCDAQATANARLIAAAPELLAALETLDQLERGQVGWHEDAKPEAWVKARSAIAKAKGEPKRIAFFILETRVNSQGEYNALIAVEDEPGFNTTDWYWGKTLN